MKTLKIRARTASYITLVLSGDYKLDGLELKPTRKLIRRQKAEARKLLDTAVKRVVVETINATDTAAKEGRLLDGNDQPCKTAYFSVKPAYGSIGLLPYIQKAEIKADRDDVLRVITSMVMADELEKVGVVKGVEVPVEEANNFQIRYRSIRCVAATRSTQGFIENK
jgi:DNA helicase HerA-like ATPase